MGTMKEVGDEPKQSREEHGADDAVSSGRSCSPDAPDEVEDGQADLVEEESVCLITDVRTLTSNGSADESVDEEMGGVPNTDADDNGGGGGP